MNIGDLACFVVQYIKKKTKNEHNYFFDFCPKDKKKIKVPNMLKETY